MSETIDADLLRRLRQQFSSGANFVHHLGSEIVEIQPGHAVLTITIGEMHLNANGTVHGGVYAALIDTTMGMAVAAQAAVRIATTQMNVHFLAAIGTGRIICTGDLIHRTRRTATAEAKVRDADGNLLAMGTAAFRIFEQPGHPIV